MLLWCKGLIFIMEGKPSVKSFTVGALMNAVVQLDLNNHRYWTTHIEL